MLFVELDIKAANCKKPGIKQTQPSLYSLI
jgi:hypothetical protein